MELKCLMKKAYYDRDTISRNDVKVSKNDVACPEIHLDEVMLATWQECFNALP